MERRGVELCGDRVAKPEALCRTGKKRCWGASVGKRQAGEKDWFGRETEGHGAC